MSLWFGCQGHSIETIIVFHWLINLQGLQLASVYLAGLTYVETPSRIRYGVLLQLRIRGPVTLVYPWDERVIVLISR